MKDKIYAVIGCMLLVAIAIQYVTNRNLLIKYSTVSAENKTLQEALKNPKVVIKPKIIYREVVKTVNVPVEYTDQDEVIKSLNGYIKDLEDTIYGEKPDVPVNIVEVIKEIPKEVLIESADDTEQVRQLREYIRNLEDAFYQLAGKETTREIIYEGGSESEAILPSVLPDRNNPSVPLPKKWTGLAEYKLDNGVNIGVAKKVYKTTSVGISLNEKGKVGVLGTVQW